MCRMRVQGRSLTTFSSKQGRVDRRSAMLRSLCYCECCKLNSLRDMLDTATS